MRSNKIAYVFLFEKLIEKFDWMPFRTVSERKSKINKDTYDSNNNNNKTNFNLSSVKLFVYTFRHHQSITSNKIYSINKYGRTSRNLASVNFFVFDLSLRFYFYLRRGSFDFLGGHRHPGATETDRNKIGKKYLYSPFNNLNKTANSAEKNAKSANLPNCKNEYSCMLQSN